ncbi:MAG TPA: glycosyl hydrolase [Sedimentisphaerales bacterium]|nr:glycosyl hydrolase [Sedimentisphaerales bacterium]
MKTTVFTLLACLASVGLAADRLDDEFLSPPRECRPETWFHFNGNNISKEGITKDLEAIQYAGIRGIQLFSKAGQPYPNVPQVKILSPEWREMMRHVANECKRLGLDFTMQNCPGWSMAGGPWVPVEGAQRELVQMVTHIEGGRSFDDTISVNKAHLGKDSDYQDICVMAFPTPRGDALSPFIPVSIETNNAAVDWERIFDPERCLKLPSKAIGPLVKKHQNLHVTKVKGQDTYVQVRFAEPVTLRSLTMPPIRHMVLDWGSPRTDIKLILQTVERNQLTTVAEVLVPHSCWMDRQDDLTLALPEITTRELRVTFAGKQEIFLAHLFFQSNPRIHNWEAKAAFALRSLEQAIVRAYSPLCCVDPSSVLDLTDKMDDSGRLTWSVPAGSWTVVRFGHVNMRKTNGPAAKEAIGWECSKLDKIALENHLRKGMVGSLIGPGGPCGDGKLHGLLLDSWERYIPTWTIDRDAVFKEFRKRRGYDMRPYMPAMMGYIVQNQAHTDKFLRDLRETMSDLFVENFFGHFQTLAHEFGTILYTESASGDVLPGDALRYYGVSDVPMTEYWYTGNSSTTRLDLKPALYASSAAHLYDKKRVAAEACTEGGCDWREHPFSVKALMDYHYALGVNHVIFHTFSHTPQAEVYPGSSFGGTTGFPLVRNQTWWRHMPAWTDYLTRCQYILQGGEYVADVLWYLGDELERPPFQTAPFPQGYRLDLLNPEVLHTRLSVQNGKIRVKDGGEYRVIMLRNSNRMLRSTAQRIKDLVLAGAVILGDKPQESPSLMDGPEDLKVLNTIADQLWGDDASGVKTVGKGKVYWGKDLQEVLRQEAIAQDVVIPAGLDIPWIHRQIDDADVYFLSNQKKEAVDASIGFRVTGKQPEFWDSHTGRQQEAGLWQVKDGRTHVAISFAPQGSAIVVFRKSVARPSWTKVRHAGDVRLDSVPGWSRVHKENDSISCRVEPASLMAWESGDYTLTGSDGRQKTVSVAGQSQSCDQNWKLSFGEGWDAPQTMELETLQSLTECSLGPVRYYSGTVTYQKRVELSCSGEKVILDLGDVCNIAEVWCNGQKVGTRWSPPFTFDLTEAARRGANDLEIKVTNAWRNQLIYDLQRPEAEKKTWTTNPPRNRNEPPSPSGLIGPVDIRIGMVAEI